MSTLATDAPSVETAAVKTPARDLATCTEKLASLRFLVVLAARRESSGGVAFSSREQAHGELALLRRQYSALIDEIAMNFGVQEAMDAKEMVEKKVSLPSGWRPPASLRDEF